LTVVVYTSAVAVPRIHELLVGRNTYTRVSELVGRPIRAIQASDGSTRWLASNSGTSTAHVLYLFSTTCHFCESQKSHVARLLNGLPSGSVVTASVEPAWRTNGYWRSVQSRLPAPMSLDSAWVRLLGIRAVPTLIFIEPNGTVHEAVTGVVLDWTPQQMRDQLASAGGPATSDGSQR
jgi:hypothetical protein